MQVTLIRLAIDFYPCNLISNARVDWARYQTPNHFTDMVEKGLVKHFQRICAELGKHKKGGTIKRVGGIKARISKFSSCTKMMARVP